MSRVIDIYIPEELDKKITAAKETVVRLMQMKADSEKAGIDLDYSEIPEYLELEQRIAVLREELADAALKRISLSF